MALVSIWEFAPVLRYYHFLSGNLVQLWKFYALGPSQGKKFQEQQDKLEAVFKKALDIHKEMVGSHAIISGVRSASPCSDADMQR